MTLAVAATSPEGRFVSLERVTSEDELSDLMDALQRRGQGYVEIRDAEASWPMLAVGLAENRAVIHLFENSGSVSLLRGPGPLFAEPIDVQIMDELATFDGAFTLSLEIAREVVQQFVRGSLSDELTWFRL